MSVVVLITELKFWKREIIRYFWAISRIEQAALSASLGLRLPKAQRSRYRLPKGHATVWPKVALPFAQRSRYLSPDGQVTFRPMVRIPFGERDTGGSDTYDIAYGNH